MPPCANRDTARSAPPAQRRRSRPSRADPPAVVIVDLLMPGTDGFEFISRLRASPAGRDVPIIVWTVKDIDGDERRRLGASACAIVSKGTGEPHALVEELRRLLPVALPEPAGN